VSQPTGTVALPYIPADLLRIVTDYAIDPEQDVVWILASKQTHDPSEPMHLEVLPTMDVVRTMAENRLDRLSGVIHTARKMEQAERRHPPAQKVFRPRNVREKQLNRQAHTDRTLWVQRQRDGLLRQPEIDNLPSPIHVLTTPTPPDIFRNYLFNRFNTTMLMISRCDTVSRELQLLRQLPPRSSRPMQMSSDDKYLLKKHRGEATDDSMSEQEEYVDEEAQEEQEDEQDEEPEEEEEQAEESTNKRRKLDSK